MKSNVAKALVGPTGGRPKLLGPKMDGTGPHGQGMGPGQGKGDHLWKPKAAMTIKALRGGKKP
jgi:hypothetical protein